jgi:hypothetical protein
VYTDVRVRGARRGSRLARRLRPGGRPGADGTATRLRSSCPATPAASTCSAHRAAPPPRRAAAGPGRPPSRRAPQPTGHQRRRVAHRGPPHHRTEPARAGRQTGGYGTSGEVCAGGPGWRREWRHEQPRGRPRWIHRQQLTEYCRPADAGGQAPVSRRQRPGSVSGWPSASFRARFRRRWGCPPGSRGRALNRGRRRRQARRSRILSPAPRL